MRIALVALLLSMGLLLSISLGTAHAQQAAPKSAAQKSIGHSVIPEKIGKPLRPSLTSSDVSLEVKPPRRPDDRQRRMRSKIPTR